MTSPAECASNHMLIEMLIMLSKNESVGAKKIFPPLPHKRNSAAGNVARTLNRVDLKRLAAKPKLRACGLKIVFHVHVEELQDVIEKPWMVTVKKSLHGTQKSGRTSQIEPQSSDRRS